MELTTLTFIIAMGLCVFARSPDADTTDKKADSDTAEDLGDDNDYSGDPDADDDLIQSMLAPSYGNLESTFLKSLDEKLGEIMEPTIVEMKQLNRTKSFGSA